MDKYELNEVEQDIQATDFPEGSVWHELIKYCGPASVVILAKYNQTVSGDLSIRDYSGFVRKAQDRDFRKSVSRGTKVQTPPIPTP